MYDHSIGYWIIKKARQVIGVSSTACQFTKHLGAKGPTRIPNGVVLLDGIDSSRLDASVILYVGRLIQAKGVQDLIEVFKMTSSRFHLAIVGSGPYCERLQEIASMCDNIRFYGELTGKSLEVLYRHAAIFVNPSYSEGLPTAVMEAAAAGVPLIATDVGGTQDIVQQGITGLLVKPKDIDGLMYAINWMLDNRETAWRMADVCRERLSSLYSWDKITDQYCELLEDLCKGIGV